MQASAHPMSCRSSSGEPLKGMGSPGPEIWSPGRLSKGVWGLQALGAAPGWQPAQGAGNFSPAGPKELNPATAG